MVGIAIVIGGGAAGFFGALAAAEALPKLKVTILERSTQLLSKVKISGGGRCNVTHACYDPRQLVQYYPRGRQELLGPFHRFQPQDTVDWFAQRGVSLHTEADGRMFPTSNHSQTIIDCFMKEANTHNVQIKRQQGVRQLQKQEEHWAVTLSSGEVLTADTVLLATGSQPAGHRLAHSLGHTIVEPVPSLFTFNVPSSPLLDLAGLSVTDACVRLPQVRLEQRGPVLVTHWGFSGPAALKLSAWGARELHSCQYQTPMEINWLPNLSYEQLLEQLAACKSSQASTLVKNTSPFAVPRKLWQRQVQRAAIPDTLRWSHLSKTAMRLLAQHLHRDTYQVNGKTTYKEEFVTCGGIALDEVRFQTMESRRQSGLFFAGEVLNIDGVTGGFNFQAAWTSGWLAGQAMAAR